ncbi:hypothetical protein BOTBODRAFT_37985 [Botryobasidium botryosum FD-172 SS1]|uniref:C2 domain-containing protein n=1 Tax=Botryobasidium botryosum (strain FD-172 SS1) TaxID=930990 RepID=A0A067LYU2_BOTB1|nr:hypothetical protein BOTBODRAFT_37985 [Botryobasidium botryosum FD-172 SS1]
MKISVLSASNLPPSPHRHADPKAFVVLTIADQIYRTKDAKRSKSPEWGEEFVLLEDDTSMLKFELKGVSGLVTSRKFRTEYIIGAATLKLKELREKQKRNLSSTGENSDLITLDLLTTFSSDPQPSITLRLHSSAAESSRELEATSELVSNIRHDVLEMQTGMMLPAVPTYLSDGASFTRNLAGDIESIKEVGAFYEKAITSVAAFAKLVDALAEIHPYVKAAWTVLSAGYKMAMAQKDRDDALVELLESMSTALNLVQRFDKTAVHSEDISVILQIAKKTNECALFIREYTRTKNFALRTVKGTFSNSGDEIARFQQDFVTLRRNLDTGAILSLTEGLSGVNELLYNVEECVKDVGRNVDRVAQAVLLDKLPCAEGASWDSAKVCLPNTRVALLDDVWQWIKSAETGDVAEILCLTGVAGSGKSAIAHTIARRCHEEGILASSFFFSRDTEGRNHPKKLLSTIARDLTRDPRIREHISLAIEADQSLATASLSRQFEHLIAEPCLQYPFSTPTVFVIDALDEGYTVELFKILHGGISRLPKTFRIFLTSREMEDIVIHLPQSTYVRFMTIDIDTEGGLADTRIYIQHGLGDMARTRHLGEGWPGQQLMDRLVSKSEGLIQWASAILQALENAYDPTRKLVTLLADTGTGLAPEKKMDEIYTRILQACDWGDDDFKRDYNLIMGAILAAKRPLSASALQSLNPTIPDVSKIISRAGALLTGWRHPEKPVRILHLSLRDFLTTRAQQSPFSICEEEHSRRLAYSCLTVLDEGLPVVKENQTSEELWYACEFWAAHITDIQPPVPTYLIKLLQRFVSTHVIAWMEVCASMGSFQSFHRARTWIQGTLPEEILLNVYANPRVARALHELTTRLFALERQEEAVAAGKDAVELYRLLANDGPAFDGRLADSLHILSVQLSYTGRRDDAFQAGSEAVQLYRQLASDHPAVYNSQLARALHDLAIRFAEMGRLEDAVMASRESMELQRQLRKECLTTNEPNDDFANCLNQLAYNLLGLGLQEDALTAAREAVKLHRQLEKDCPIAFHWHELANSLDTLSSCLSALGHHEEALAAIREAVELQRKPENKYSQSLSQRVYSPMFLNTLSITLSNLGRHEEALVAAKEAVELSRQLAIKLPALVNHRLAECLRNFSTSLRNVGQEDDARVAELEADELDRNIR